MEPYLTVKGPVRHEIEVKKSRFLCSIGRVEDEAEAQAFIASVRKRYWDARHNCTAYVIGDQPRRERSNDDAEPAGTAGAPMLEVIRRRGLTDTVAVVTRYFGGVLLGAGGLVRAYGGAVSAALDQAVIVERQLVALFAVTTDHARAGRLENDLRAAGHVVRDVRYSADGVCFDVGVPESAVAAFGAWLASVTAGSAEVERSGSDRVDIVPGS
ncbi:YigZ family protein [Streptacidiphilus sp. PB12-B1b]|uniref:YigZ family protein n=1 Tax=Streptacidiphilus sp. PB12-B1b TaxID=2705012 RepID=UPI0015FCFFB4|nr:YigZ family protein [Streptacidiphilus sp. PB12-B1b]QMU77506.1 YigZ family protein [Streptacidiphilus sp. PB12-B1b]